MDETVSVTVQEDQTATGNIVLVPTIASGQMRIVLTWGTTGDLDSYLWNPSGEKLYYGNKIISDASLDVDNTAGYGPETVTITTLNNGVYTYKVNDCGLCMMDFFFDDPFGDCYTITTCDAVVKLYDSNGLVNTFTPPDVISSSGAYWTVFTITVDGENVTVTTINTID